MNRVCGCCGSSFDILQSDLQFYNKLAIPVPSWCPACREMRRMAWCNEGVLYARSCDLCGKRAISQFAPSNPRQAYCVSCWWGDKWDAMEYGRPVDLQRPFLSQLQGLLLATPHCHTNTDLSNENSEYTHHAGHEKNCYMMFHTSFAEDCYYGYGVKKARDCIDNHYCHESELCYECVDVQRCYDLAWSQDCNDCSSGRFLYDCAGCKSCFLCVGLKNQEYCFLNQQLSKAEYHRRVSEVNHGSAAVVAECLAKLEKLKSTHIRKNLQMTMVENCSGNHLYNARESHDCFDCSDIEHSRYCSQLQLGTSHCHDIYQFGLNIELCFDSAMIGYQIYNCHFCFDLLDHCSDLQYCVSCSSTKDSFGCFGFRHKQYCILNQQYTRDDYLALNQKIVARMQSDGEYGEMLPINLSPHGYNETMAMAWYPKTREEVLSRGWAWEDNLPFPSGGATLKHSWDAISDVPETVLREVLCCAECGRDYRVISQELAYYRKHAFPLPRHCFQCRRARRMAQREPRRLWTRSCGQCGVQMQSCIDLQRPEQVYCEQCYLGRAY